MAAERGEGREMRDDGWARHLTKSVGFCASPGGDGSTLVCDFWEFKET